MKRSKRAPESNSGRRPRRLWRTSSLLLAAAWTLAGCGTRREPQASAGQQPPRRGGTFVMAQDAPGSLDPACVDDVYEATVVNQVFDGLLNFDTHLNTVPSIASSWVISQDGRTYTFEIKPGLRFHDGTELTAEDVVYSLARVFRLPEDQVMLAREYLCRIEGSQDYAAGRADHVRGLRAMGPYTVEIQLETPYASFLAVLASEMSRVVPRRYVERVGNEAFARRPIGSGPFRFAGWTPGDRVVLTAFEEYTPRAWLDSLVLELPEHDTSDYAVAQYLAGRLSALVVPDGRMQEFADLPGTTLLTRQQLTSTFIGLNSHREPFDDVRVRQAFALAIDRAPILAHRPESRLQAHGILPPGMPGFTPESKFLPHDLERARILLAAAGYPGGQGLPRIVFTTASRNEQTLELIRQIAGQVGQVGFELQIEHLGWLDFSRRLTGRDLQCYSVSWVADVPDPDSFLYPLCHSQGSANYGNFDDPEVDELLARGRRTGSSLARLEVYREAERRVLEQAALVPLFHPLSVIAVRREVRGLTLTSMGVGNFAMESVWLVEPAPQPAPLAQAAARPAAQAGTQLAPDPAPPVPPDAAPSRTAGAGPRPGRKP